MKDNQLNAALAAYLSAVDAGKPPARDQFIAGFPDIAEELREALAALDEIGSLAAGQPELAKPFIGTADARPTLDGSARLGDEVRYFGDYELVEEIARGGMGVVFRARQVSLNRPVALKMILDSALASPDAVRRFRREAEAAASLDHPNIVDIYEVGQHDGHNYFSMQLVAGGSLATELATRVGDEDGAAQLVELVARAVDHGHKRGIIHRDLKPANILLDKGGAPHVCDFGLARAVDDGGDLTHTGAILGTPAYMAPEQAAGRKEVTVATDVWSLGAILYELIAGRPPFTGATPLEVVRRVMDSSPRTLDASRDLSTITMKCLEREPAKRYATAAALADDLHAYRAGLPIDARPIGRMERTLKWARRRPAAAGLIVVSALALLVFLVGSGVFLQREKELHAETAENLNRARALGLAAASYELAQDGRSTAALLLAHEAVQYDPHPRTIQRLRDALNAPPEPRTTLSSRLMALGGFTLHPDGELILAFEESWVHGDNTPRLFTLEGDLVREFRGHTGQVVSARWTRDGAKLLTTALDGTVRLWDLEGDGSTVFRGDFPSQLARIAPNRETLVTTFGSAGLAQLWTAAGERIAILETKGLDTGQNAVCLQYSSDSSLILCATDNRHVQVWDASGEPLVDFRLAPRKRDEEHSPVIARFVSGGRNILTTAPGAGLELWDLNGRKVAVLEGHTGRVLSVDISPDGQLLLTASVDGTARLYDLNGNHVQVFQHEDEVLCASFAPESARIVTGCKDGSSAIWALDGRKLHSWKVGDEEVERARFSQDERFLVTGERFGVDVHLWEQEATQSVFHGDGVCSAKFASNDRDILVACNDASIVRFVSDSLAEQVLAPHMSSRTLDVFYSGGPVTVSAAAAGPVYLLEGRSWQLTRMFGHTDQVLDVDLAQNGELLVTGSRDGTARTWTRDGSARSVLNCGGWVREVSISPDAGSILLLVGSHELVLWSGEGEEVLHLEGSEDRVTLARFSRDGERILATSIDGTARTWRRDGTRDVVLAEHAHAVVDAAAAPAGSHFATACLDGVVRLFDAGGALVRELAGLSHARELEFSADGAWLAFVRAEGTAEVHHVATGASHIVESDRDPVRFVALRPNDELVFWREGGDFARLALPRNGAGEWNLESEEKMLFSPTAAALSSDGRFAGVAGEHVSWRASFDMEGDEDVDKGKGGVHIIQPWFLPGGEVRSVLPQHRFTTIYDEQGEELHKLPVTGLKAMSANGEWVVGYSEDGHARLFSMSGGGSVDLHIGSEDGYISAAAFSPDDESLLLAGWSGELKEFALDGRVVREFPGATTRISRIEFAPSGDRFLANEHNGQCRIWTTDGETIAVLGEGARTKDSDYREHETIGVATWSPDGARILTGSSEGTIAMLDRNGEVLFEIHRHTTNLERVAFSPDGRYFATADHDGRVFLWDSFGKECSLLPSHDGWIHSIEFSADSSLVMTAGRDDLVQVSPVETSVLLDRARARLRRDFNREEVAEYDDLLSDETKQRALRD